jgi:hypothetical protein
MFGLQSGGLLLMNTFSGNAKECVTKTILISTRVGRLRLHGTRQAMRRETVYNPTGIQPLSGDHLSCEARV